MLDWQFVPEPGVFDWRTSVRDRIDTWAPAATDAAGAVLWARIAPAVRQVVARADPLSVDMARTLAAALRPTRSGWITPPSPVVSPHWRRTSDCG